FKPTVEQIVLSQWVGPKGSVTGPDVDAKLLDAARALVEGDSLGNVTLVQRVEANRSSHSRHRAREGPDHCQDDRAAHARPAPTPGTGAGGVQALTFGRSGDRRSRMLT